MKKYGYPIVVAILVVISVGALYVAGTNYNEIKSVKSKYVDLDKKYNSLKKEDAEKDAYTKKIIKSSKGKDEQLANFLKKIGTSSETVESNSTTQNTSETTTDDSKVSNESKTGNTATESDLDSLNKFAEEKRKELEEEQKSKDSEPQYAKATGEEGRSAWVFSQAHGLSIDELLELNPNLTASNFKYDETYRIK